MCWGQGKIIFWSAAVKLKKDEKNWEVLVLSESVKVIQY